ncbi:MAG: carbohydrate kinase family protein, partial [Anaerolineales bacterium]|nr:carbohydrate kinase family protein [Anaerolineales bacterium]
NFNNDQPRFFGGTAFNIAVQLAKLGEEVSIVHPVGKDFLGSEYEQYLLNHGIQLEGLQINTNKPSGFAYVFFTEEGSTLCFSYPTQSTKVTIPQSLLKQIELIVFTPKFSALYKSLIKHAIAFSVPVVIIGIAEAFILDLLTQTTMLSLNDHETKQLSIKMGGIPLQDITKEMPGVLFETSGKKGCKIYQNGEMIGIVDAVPPEEMVDPTGAGDSFAAAALAGLRYGFNPIEAAQIGAVSASFVLEAFGCQTNIPDWEKISKRLMLFHPGLAKKIVKEVN